MPHKILIRRVKILIDVSKRALSMIVDIRKKIQHITPMFLKIEE